MSSEVRTRSLSGKAPKKGDESCDRGSLEVPREGVDEDQK